ncbi:hypothetical protein Taro_011127 [Colocasia esculenta]|uniref:Uncharacterized protein n=1 Tax=Colocasia esculenta TaxID=4460 RepID=A0A843U0Q4_COLES|nr:hypothetical protein [Colocasia esculenta]
MAAFLRRLSTHFGSPLGMLLSGSDQLRSRGGLFAGRLSRIPEAMGGWRGSGGVPFSSWTGGAGTWQYQSYQRPRIARWGDWACLGLTALAGGLYWTSGSPREVPITEWLPHIVLLYGALRYSLKILKGLIFQEYEREYKACLDEVDNILEDLEDAISYKMEDAFQNVPLDSGDPILVSASILLQRIEKLKEFLTRKPRANSRFLQRRKDFDFVSTKVFVEQLSRLEMLVKRVVKSHVVNKVYIIHNKELLAKVDNLLLSLDKEK